MRPGSCVRSSCSECSNTQVGSRLVHPYGIYEGISGRGASVERILPSSPDSRRNMIRCCFGISLVVVLDPWMASSTKTVCVSRYTLVSSDIVEVKHIMLPPSPRDFKDIYVVFELMETDLHQVGSPSLKSSQPSPSPVCTCTCLPFFDAHPLKKTESMT